MAAKIDTLFKTRRKDLNLVGRKNKFGILDYFVDVILIIRLDDSIRKIETC